MKIARLLELKQRLYREKDLSKIWSFYMDHFSGRAKFAELGRPVVNESLEYVIGRICREMFRIETKIDNILIIQVEKYQFFHCTFMVKDYIGGLIFFEETKMGLVAVSTFANPKVMYSRFTEMMPMKHSEPKPNGLN